jgi:hypothetical protein
LNTRVQVYVYIALYGVVMVLFGVLGMKFYQQGRLPPAILTGVADLYLLVRIGLLARKLRREDDRPSSY